MKQENKNQDVELSVVAEEYFPQLILDEEGAFILEDNEQITLDEDRSNELISELSSILLFVSIDAMIGFYQPTNWIGDGSQEFDAESQSLDLESLAGEYDTKADQLHSEAKHLYLDANKEYRKDANRKYPYIRINSGVRNTVRQAELYIAFLQSRYGGPAAPRANKPGKSNHEYGLAIDVIRKLDEARLKSALVSKAWKNDIADEGWHFDAAGIKSWSDLQKKITKIGTQYSNPFGTDVASQFEYEKLIKENYPKYQSEATRLQAEQQRLLEEQKRLNSELDRLKKQEVSINGEIEAVNREVASLKRLRTKIEKFRYTYCPNGKTFENCNHVEQKRRYINERNAMVDEYNRRARALANRSNNLKGRINRHKSESQRFNSDAARFKQEADQFKKDIESLNKLANRIKKWIDRRQKILDERPKKIKEIADEVAKVRAES